MTVDQTLIAYPHAAAVIPDRTEMLGYREYLQRHGVKPKQFKGTLVDRGSDSLLVVADGVIYSGRGTWPRGTPKEGKSAEAFMKLGGHWLASSDDQRDLDVRLYFQAYPEKRATFSGQWVFHAFPVFRVDLWSLQMNIRFQNGKVVRTSRREISD